MEEAKRIRVEFKDDDILTETQKSVGLSRSWVLLKPHQHDTVSDVAHHLLRAFQLHQSCPHGLILSISGFVLPPFESIHILKDDEIVRVQKRQDILSIEANNTANDVEKLKAVEKQPVNSGLLLLANEEFEKEKGGYESDDNKEDDEEDLLEDVESPSVANADKKNRKRKAADKLQYSKKKKQRSDANTSNDAQTDKFHYSDQDADLNKKKSLTSKVDKDDSIAGDSVQNNGEQRRDKVQENIKGTEDAKTAPKETIKRPSRSARRKSDKRRWLREMAKIQKQNATCESEGLRNWKEDQAKAYKKKVDGQVKKPNKWKNHQADAEVNAVDGRPKGLLHWTPQENWFVKGKKRKAQSQIDNFSKLPNRNDDAREEQQIQTGDGHEQPTQNGDGLQQPNHKQSDSHEQPGQKSAVVQECKNQSCDASEQLDQESGEENEVVPIIIRPGHIRFEPLGKEQTVQKDHATQETFQWNGITSKKKGQQWGKESRPFTPRNDYKTSNKECSEVSSNEKEKQADEETDLDKLPFLLGMLKKGDLIAYRLLELSSSWTPELSAYRVGKVSWYNAESNQTMLLPVPEYPIVSKKDDEDEAVQPALYKEDGSLEIDFSSLIDVRIFNNGRSEPGNEALKVSASDVHAPKTVLASSSDKQTVVTSQDAMESNQGEEKQLPTAENGGATVSIWDQVTEALNAKKEQLSKQKGWGITPKKVQATQENSWGEKPSPGINGGKNPTQGNSWGKKPSPGSNSGKNAQKAQPTQENSWGKQNQGNKSWSYKALRSSGLGQTMAILRSKKDIGE